MQLRAAMKHYLGFLLSIVWTAQLVIWLVDASTTGGSLKVTVS